MGFVLEVELTHEDLVLGPTIETVSETTIRYEYADRRGTDRYLFVSAFGTDHETVDRAIDADHTVTDPVRVAEFPNRTIYRVTFASALDPLPEQCSEGGLFVFKLTSDERGWVVRLYLPDRETLSAFREFCLERGIDFHIRQLQESNPDDATYVLTERQHEIVNHGIVVSPEAGETKVFDTTVTHETAGGYPFWIRGSDSRDRVLAARVSISGEAGDAAGFREGIRCERNNCRFTELEVEQPGREGVERDALAVLGEDTTVYRATLEASRYPYVDRGTDNLLRNAELESDGDNAGVHLAPDAAGSTLKVNRIHDGIRDRGAGETHTWNNEHV